MFQRRSFISRPRELRPLESYRNVNIAAVIENRGTYGLNSIIFVLRVKRGC